MSYIIPLGVGPPTRKTQLVLTGLGININLVAGHFMNQVNIGDLETLSQNVVYALPARAVFIFSNAALEISNQTNSGFTALTATTTTGEVVAGGFVRCTTGNAIVSVKLQ